tara:strand:- start:699 stop:968 length:270 start_codon:yes stop_codon:yes gene_type:complete
MAKQKSKPTISRMPNSETFLKETDIDQLADTFFRSETLNKFGREQGRKIAKAMALSLVTSQYLDMLMLETTEPELELELYELEISPTLH